MYVQYVCIDNHSVYFFVLKTVYRQYPAIDLCQQSDQVNGDCISKFEFELQGKIEQTKKVNKYHIINKNLTDFWVDKNAHTYKKKDEKK